MRKWTLWGGAAAAGVLLLVGLALLSPYLGRALARLPETDEPPAPGRLEIDESHPFADGGEVTVSLGAGRLEVRGWDRPEIAVSGFLADNGRSRFRVEVDGEVARVVVEDRRRHGLKALLPSGAGGVGELTVHLPRGSAANVDTGSAEVTVADVDGSVRVSGAVGRVAVAGTPARVDVDGVSGDVRFAGSSREIHADLVSGDVWLVSDDVAVLEVVTISGSVSFAGSLAAGVDANVQTVSGDVDLALPPDVDAEIHIETRAGIGSDLGPEPRGLGAAKILDFVAGNGDGKVRVESAGGTVRLRTAEPGRRAAAAAPDAREAPAQ
jgi:hypothetical protein